MHATACAYYRSPSEDTMNAALEEALPLCALIARRFSGRGVEYEDLYQVAAMACVSALKKFDETKGLRFTTFVTPTITGTLRNYLRDKAGMLHTPRGMKEQSAQLAAAREKFLNEHHREATPNELSQMLGWDISQVLMVLSAQEANTVSSLDQTDDEGLSTGERIPFIEQGFEKTERKQDLLKALSALSDAEKQLIFLRYQKRLSQREIAQQMGLSQMQVSRMERRALALLRKEIEGDA